MLRRFGIGRDVVQASKIEVLRDIATITNSCKEMEGWLEDVHRKGIPVKIKVCIYQNRILWSLL